jgi:hypothetical protein
MDKRVDTIKIGRTKFNVIAAEGSTCEGCIFRRCNHCPEEINYEWNCMNYRPGHFGAPVRFGLNPKNPKNPNKLNKILDKYVV